MHLTFCRQCGVGCVFLILILSGLPLLHTRAQERAKVPRTPEELKAKAEGGDADSELWLAACYELGIDGLPKDITEAMKWYRKAAEHDNALAQTCIGLSYFDGSNVPKDHGEAVKWFRKAAQHGEAQSEWMLGRCYLNGWGVIKDEAQAVKWTQKSAKQNYPAAQHLLGACYVDALGIAKNEFEGVKWYRKAAEQNYAAAQRSLGLAYSNGEGVVKDEVEGYKWFALAAAQGDENANKYLLLSKDRLRPEQIEAGQKRARDFRPTKGVSSTVGPQ
jgi:TPR repeat protein